MSDRVTRPMRMSRGDNSYEDDKDSAMQLDLPLRPRSDDLT